MFRQKWKVDKMSSFQNPEKKSNPALPVDQYTVEQTGQNVHSVKFRKEINTLKKWQVRKMSSCQNPGRNQYTAKIQSAQNEQFEKFRKESDTPAISIQRKQRKFQVLKMSS